MTSLDSEIDQSEIRTKTPATLGCTRPSHNALHSISVLLIICQQIWPAQSIHKVFLQIFPKVTLFSQNCVLPSIPEMPWKLNKRTHDTVLLYQTAKAEKKVRVNDCEDTLCEPKVVGCLSERKKWRWWELQIVLQMEWNNLGLLLTCSSWLVCWLMFRAQLVEKPDWTFQCVRDRISGPIRIKASFDLRSLRVQEILNVVSTNAVQWQEERSVWSQPKNSGI